ncbi:hypothetical protein [Allobranchiibius huperziae]|uniref:Transcriptional regulator with XRE-family HTH domain n=1 Tax=Allobranchiibius huperziae TaxID=1874116 RepID=A0A853DQR6_9MICO|nr:hypothetical protein [Allobranchiibius huperziae]NYJ76465.1 transcriptional regulator with XRE-family HTH domain [Allobranchiibius huperziae]
MAQTSVSEKVDFLFKNVPAVTGDPASPAAAVAWIAEQDGPTYSSGHLRNVRSGHRSGAPSFELLSWLARYFAIPIEFFSDNDVELAIRTDIARLQTEAVALRSELATKVFSMTPEQLAELRAHLDDH